MDAKFSYCEFYENFAKFRETRNQNLGDIYAMSRNTKSLLGKTFANLGKIYVFLLDFKKI